MHKMSYMFFFLYLTSSVSLVKRLPLHTSHVTYTVGKKCISTAMVPLPSHVSQRPPFTLKENLPGPHPRRRASAVSANRSRIKVNEPVYVAGFERGVRPIADWSIRTVRERYSVPVKLSQLKISAVRYL